MNNYRVIINKSPSVFEIDCVGVPSLIDFLKVNLNAYTGCPFAIYVDGKQDAIIQGILDEDWIDELVKELGAK